MDHLRAIVGVDDVTEPPITYHFGEVVAPITAGDCFLFLDGDRELRDEPDMENPLGPVPYESHVAPLSVGQTVRVMMIGAVPRIVGRLA